MTFAAALQQLFEAAGNPTLKSVAEAVTRRARPTGTVVKRGLYARIGEWKSGKHLPREFDSLVMLVLAELIERAQGRGAADTIPTRMEQWRQIWQDTVDERGEGDAEAQCPYPGLAPFTAADADRFFGRDPAIVEVLELIEAARGEGGGIVSVVGISGAGKSSLLAAGVVPRLRDTGLRAAVLRPGARPGSALAEAISDPETLPDTPVADPPTAVGLVAQIRSWARSACGAVLVVDQAEELFTAAEEADREVFLEVVAEVIQPSPTPIVVLIGLRADFVADWLGYPVLRRSYRHTVVLGPMSRPELEAAITAPATRAGVTLAPGLADRVIVELCGPGSAEYEAGSLPLLGHALTIAWQHRTGRRLTIEDYDAAGGVTGALNDSAEQMWRRLDDSQRAQIRRLLLRLVHIGEGTRDSRLTRPVSRLVDRPAAEAALAALVDARLVTVDSDDQVTLTHEVVITGWPRLAGWVEEDRADLLTRQRLQTAAEAWESAGRERSQLYRGTQLVRAQEALATGEVSALADEFVEMSTNSQLRRSRARLFGRLALVLATVLALVLSVTLYYARVGADKQRREAELGQLTAEIDRLWSADPTSAAQLALLAFKLDPSRTNANVLISAGNQPVADSIDTGGGAVYTVAMAPDGQVLATANADGSVQLWSIGHRPASSSRIRVLKAHAGFATAVAWSPNGKTLATTGEDGAVRLWREPTAHPGEQLTPVTLTGHRGRAVFVAWSPDGGRLASVGVDGTVRVWDARSGGQLAVMRGHQLAVRTVAWSKDGKLIASGGNDATTRLWSGSDYHQLAVLRGHTNTVHGLAFDSRSRTLATGSDDSTVQLWDVSNPSSPVERGQPLTRHTGPVWSVQFSSDDALLLTASVDGTARLWSVSGPVSPVQYGMALEGAASSLFSAAFIPGGRDVAAAGADGIVRLWSLPATVLSGHEGRVTKPGMAAGRMLSGGSEGTVNLWDITSPAKPRLLDSTQLESAGRVQQVALSSDGKVAAVASDRHTLEILRIDEKGRFAPPQVLTQQSFDQYHLAFAPGTRLLASTESDDSLQLWRIPDDGPAQRVGKPIVHDATGSWITAIAWSGNGQRLITTGLDRNLAVWNMTDPAHPHKETVTPSGHDGVINALSVSSDNRLLASGGDGGAMRIWNFDGDQVSLLAQRWNDRSATIRSLAFIDGSSRLMAAGDGQTLVVWDTEDSADSRRLGGPDSGPGAGRWYANATEDGRVVATGGDYGFLRIDIVDPEQARRRICAYTAPMSDEVWDQHVPAAIEHVDPCE